VTQEGRIKRLEHDRDHPACPWPDADTVAEWARYWVEAGMEAPRAMAAALEFLEYCEASGQAPTFFALTTLAEKV
jgi:hypothetical protein